MIGTTPARVYLLHGLLETAHHQFAPQVRAWKDEFAVVPLDLPGHGRCPLDAQDAYVALTVRYVLTIMDRFGPGQVLAASYLGGPVSVRCALARPDLVRSLVLTGFVPDVPEGVFGAWVDGFCRLADENPQMRRWYEEMHGPRWPQTLAAYASEARDRYADAVCTSARMLADLRIRTLIANGTEKSNEREAALRAARLGPLVRGCVVEGAGHVVGRDRPEAFQAAVQRFWSDGDVQPTA